MITVFVSYAPILYITHMAMREERLLISLYIQNMTNIAYYEGPIYIFN